MTTTIKTKTQRPRGLAAMSRERRSEIARMGGQAAHKYGTAHQWTSAEAQVAGRVGGAKSKRGPAKKTEG